MTTTVDITPGVRFCADWLRAKALKAREDQPTSTGWWSAYFELANDLEREARRLARDEARAAQADLLTPAAE
ncbi:hypothetical protein J2847_004117 [Azospirillum agricola]|uniref:hypothetical protein n=1 Tax=Azospirillum agricola TaxID=1720247 RepID=UPI001AE39DCB|nr:hypothetical protein [Azospirillum agricola]MBP2230808.1 hypothetical protein [Azospirillum agricola]